MPESSLHRRLVVGVVLILAGAGAMLAGLYADVPRAGLVGRRRHPGLLLGWPRPRARCIGRPVAGLGARHLQRACTAPVGNSAGAERPAQPAPYGGHRVGPDDRPGAGDHDGDPRVLGQGQRRQVHRRELLRRPGGLQRRSASRSRRPSPTTSSRPTGVASVSRLRLRQRVVRRGRQGVMGVEPETSVELVGCRWSRASSPTCATAPCWSATRSRPTTISPSVTTVDDGRSRGQEEATRWSAPTRPTTRCCSSRSRPRSTTLDRRRASPRRTTTCSSTSTTGSTGRPS